MNPERWREIEELFHSALQRPPAEQSAYLDQACGDHLELRHRVIVLLPPLEGSADFIDPPPLAGAISSLVESRDSSISASEILGRRVGHYEIQSMLGAGGMGEVYLAHDLILDRP